MRHRITKTALIAATLLLASSLSLAADSKPAPPGETKAIRNAGAPEKSAKAKRAPAKIKPVDINSAGKAELKKLRGVGDAEADRIIAGRPYLSKAHLVTRKVIPHGIYEQIKTQIIAIQKPAANKK